MEKKNDNEILRATFFAKDSTITFFLQQHQLKSRIDDFTRLLRVQLLP